MPIVKLSQQLIQNLQCPPDKSRVEYCDAEFPGLYLLLRAAGSVATFYLRYKNRDGKTCHRKLGRTCDIDLVAARKLARTVRASIALGADPQAEEKARRAVLTFTEFFTGHYLPYVKPRKRSWKRDEELFRLRLQKAFGDKRLNQIHRQEIQTFHTELLASGLAPASCDHHLKLLKHAFNLAIDWGLLADKNPAARIPLFNRDNKVEHYLEGAELERLLDVLRIDGNRTVCQIALFLLSTGARLNETLQARWVDVDVLNRVWRIPALNSKSKRIRSVPLNDAAIDVLQQLESDRRGEYLFANRRTLKPYTAVHGAWERLRNKAGLPHLRIHDLRHQYASFLVNSGRTIYEVQQILGHSSPSVTQRYAHLSSKSLQAAANSASAAIKGASKPVPAPATTPAEAVPAA